jgi:dihydroxy-acid dehydratase
MAAFRVAAMDLLFQEGGPNALVEDGDMITIDASTQELNVDLTVDEIEKRKAKWVMPPYKATKGTLWKFIKNVRYLIGLLIF